MGLVHAMRSNGPLPQVVVKGKGKEKPKAKQAEVFRFGDFELNLMSHTLLRAGREVELTPKEFRLLAYFVSRRGCALARNDILNAVWGHSIIVTSRSIDRCVATLRARIEPAYIQTIRDIGYRFEPGVD